MTNSNRVFSLSHKKREIRPTARHELNVLMVYPEDEVSRVQAIGLAIQEYDRWQRCEGIGFEHSDLVIRLAESHKRGTGQRILAGLIALAQMCLNTAGFVASPNLAMQVVSEFAATADKLRLVSVYGRDRQHEYLQTLSCDLADLRKAWSKYRAVSHVLATDLIADEHLWFEMGYEDALEANASYFNTLMAIQRSFASLPKFPEWNAWLITASPGFDPNEFPILDADALCGALFEPWLKSGRAESAKANPRLFRLDTQS